jgi:hypothetical protein
MLFMNTEKDPKISTQVLADERAKFESAMEAVANSGWTHEVEIDGKKITITDPGRSGRQASTDGKIDSEF